jgi:hypothetical protein
LALPAAGLAVDVADVLSEVLTSFSEPARLRRWQKLLSANADLALAAEAAASPGSLLVNLVERVQPPPSAPETSDRVGAAGSSESTPESTVTVAAGERVALLSALETAMVSRFRPGPSGAGLAASALPRSVQQQVARMMRHELVQSMSKQVSFSKILMVDGRVLC